MQRPGRVLEATIEGRQGIARGRCKKSFKKRGQKVGKKKFIFCTLSLEVLYFHQTVCVAFSIDLLAVVSERVERLRKEGRWSQTRC